MVPSITFTEPKAMVKKKERPTIKEMVGSNSASTLATAMFLSTRVLGQLGKEAFLFFFQSKGFYNPYTGDVFLSLPFNTAKALELCENVYGAWSHICS